MVNINNHSKQLNILTPSTNKVLKELLKEPQTFQKLQLPKDLKSLLESFLKPNLMQKEHILNLLTTNETLKSLANIDETLKDLESILKIDIANIKNIKNIDLKNALLKSGVFLESNLKNGIDIKDDLKAKILKAKADTTNPQTIQKLDKALLQIDYFQLLSHISNDNYIFLPFYWKDLKDGKIIIKKYKKDSFYCNLELDLVDYGELKIKIALSNEKNLDIKIFSNSEKLKNNLLNLEDSLKENLKKENLNLTSISFKELKKDLYLTQEELNIGFEVKV